MTRTQEQRSKILTMATSLPSQAGSALAFRVRKQLMTQAAVAMASLVNVVHERVIALMNEAASSRETQLRRDVWLAYQKEKNRWQEGVVKAWQNALMAPPPVRPTAAALAGGFELIGTEVVENKIIASRLALGLMEIAATEVNDLRTRLKSITGGRDLTPQDIVHPETLFLAVVEQWSVCGMPREAWPLINEVVRKHLFEPFKAAYSECNEVLIDQGVLPVIDFASNLKPSGFAPPAFLDRSMGASAPGALAGAQTGQPGQPGFRGAAYAGAQNMAAGAAQAPMAPGSGAGLGAYWRGSRAQGLIDQISRLLIGAAPPSQPVPLAGGGYGGASHPGMGGAAAMGVAGGGGAPYMGHPSAIHGSPSAYGAPSGQGFEGQAMVMSVPLMAALAQQPMLGDVYYTSQPGAVYEVAAPLLVKRVADQMRRQSDEVKSKAGTDAEKATVELVALMFQSILEEDRIPTGIRVWFARLQMPVLRMALAEPDFFTQLDHPTRQLIDHMGSCVLGFDASGISSAALEVEVKRIVQVIEQYPETGVRVYQRVYEEFQVFLKKHLTEKPATQKVVSVAERVEQRETLTIQYTIELRNQIKDMPVRDEIREFLYKVWAEVLAVSAVRHGPQHVETLALKKAASNLIWAASAKPNRADRARVISDLPDLLQSLRTGLTLMNVQQAAQEAHIKSISAILVEAFMSKTQAIADDQIQALAARLANLEDYVTDGGAEELPLDADSIEELLGVDATGLEVITQGGGVASPVMLEWARNLDLGAWFVLNYNHQEVHVQYAWRSPLGHLHLFASNVGRSYLVQTVRVAAYLQAALLEPQEREPLTLRATRNAMGKIEANPARLLA